ncbi:hypothetical protein AB1E18_007128 [Capra hircus]
MAKGRRRDPELLLPFASRSRSTGGGREGGRPRGRDRAREGEGAAAGGGGSLGAGKETAGAATPSDLNNFQFQERKRELEKYRRRDLAEAREEAPKGSRVCGGASLDAAKKAGEREPGAGGAEAALRAQWNPSEGRLSRGEVGALRLRVWRWKVRRPRDHPAPRPPSLPAPRGRLPSWAGLRRQRPGALRSSRGPSVPAPSRLGSRSPRASPAPRQLAPRPPGQIAGDFQATDAFPVFSSPSSCFSPFLSFFSIKVAAVGPAQGGWSGGISVDTRGHPDRPLPARRGSDSECMLMVPPVKDSGLDKETEIHAWSLRQNVEVMTV